MCVGPSPGLLLLSPVNALEINLLLKKELGIIILILPNKNIGYSLKKKLGIIILLF